MYERVNGWTNYETWVTALWLSNEFGRQRMMEAAADDALTDSKGDHEAAIDLLEQFIMVYLEQLFIRNEASLISDVLQHTYNQINIREIAESYIES